MDLKNIFNEVKKTFSIRKKVDFDEHDLHFELELPTAMEELKILEACQPFEGAQYIDQIKRHSLAYAIRKIIHKDNEIDLSVDEISDVDENGQPVTKSKYLFVLEQIDAWPTALKDVLFEVFQNLQEETEDRVQKSIKFDRFEIEEVKEEKEEKGPAGLKKVDVKDEDPSMTEVDKMSQKARQEVEQEDARVTQADIEAEENVKK